MDAATEDSLISYMDFIYAFQLQFCFDGLLSVISVKKLYTQVNKQLAIY